MFAIAGMVFMLMASGVRGTSDDPETVSALATDFTETGSSIVFSNKKCEDVSCTGTRIVDSKGKLKWCEWDRNTPGSCSGKCNYCTGPGTALVCIPITETGDCTINFGGTQDCGNIESNECYYATGHGLKAPCWCLNSGGLPASGRCGLTPCQ